MRREAAGNGVAQGLLVAVHQAAAGGEKRGGDGAAFDQLAAALGVVHLGAKALGGDEALALAGEGGGGGGREGVGGGAAVVRGGGGALLVGNGWDDEAGAGGFARD